ncbi:hypothetical protein, partial [Polyangium sp. 6x1]|uniref:hypothetical protein n=1 Tax=Polyangium sp. 6x1 TaxID=3042689 RepID=UPI0024822036
GGGDVGGSGGVGGVGGSGGVGGVGGGSGGGGAGGGGAEAFVSLDPGFGAAGLATTAGNLPNRDLVHASARQPDGKLLVAGGTSAGLYGEGLLFRANADGTLDTSFGEGGKVLVSKVGRTAFHDVVVAPNGDILVAGAITRGRRLHRVLVARVDASGHLVSSFGEGGLALGASGRAFSIGLEPDGKIIVAGLREEPAPAEPPPYLVQRLLADGSVDASFGQQGMAEVPLRNESFPSGVVLADDGKIVLCGGGNYDMAIVRLLPSGALDLGFDEDGIFAMPGFVMPYESQWAPSRAPSTCRIAMDGKILVAGESSGSPAVLRLDTSGKPDLSFGDGDGIASFNKGTRAESVQPLPNGSVLVGFNAYSGKAVARLGADGSLDTTYGAAGVGALPTACLLRDITVAPGGSVIAACKWDFPLDVGVTLAQLTPQGAQDTAYGQGGGLAVLQSGATTDAAFSVRATEDGKIISAGTTSYFSAFENAMVTRHLPDGTLDAGFGAGGVVVLDTFTNAMGFGVQPDGKVIVAGETPDPSLRLVARLDTTGALDASFGLGGIVGLDSPPHGRPRALAVDSLGRVVIGGNLMGLPINTPYVARLLATGEPDLDFGNLGVASFDSFAGSVEDLLTLADGRIVGAGTPAGESKNSVVMRLLPSGALDPAFGNAGRVILNNAFSAGRMVQEVDGGLLLAGLIPKTGDDQTFEVGVARLDVNGARDMTFGTNGLLAVAVEGVAVYEAVPTLDDGPALVPLPDRSFYVATTAHLDRDTIVVFKFLPDGKPDTSFGNGGRAVVPAAGAWGAYDGLLQPDGKVVLAGRGFSPKSGTDFGLVRFAP